MSAVLLEGVDERVHHPPPLIRTILLATDLSPSALDAALYAMELASQLEAQLVIASVIDVVAPIPALGPRIDQIRAEREAGVQALVARARGVGARATFLVWQGDPGPTILSAAEAERADLIVIGTHGREGVSRLLLGSVSDHVVRQARCPVLVVRGHSTLD
jgi:nucleotide-binding universal stress UspA family protein